MIISIKEYELMNMENLSGDLISSHDIVTRWDFNLLNS
jgi:hypothetical protein